MAVSRWLSWDSCDSRAAQWGRRRSAAAPQFGELAVAPEDEFLSLPVGERVVIDECAQVPNEHLCLGELCTKAPSRRDLSEVLLRSLSQLTNRLKRLGIEPRGRVPGNSSPAGDVTPQSSQSQYGK